MYALVCILELKFLLTRIWKGTNISLVKSAAYTRMKGIREKTTVITSAAFDVGCFNLKKMTNKLKVQLFSVCNSLPLQPDRYKMYLFLLVEPMSHLLIFKCVLVQNNQLLYFIDSIEEEVSSILQHFAAFAMCEGQSREKLEHHHIKVEGLSPHKIS